MEQAGVIKACLDDFCSATGEKVSEAKSRIFFSSNMNHTRRNEISGFLCFTATADLGKYLGSPYITNVSLNRHKIDKRARNFLWGSTGSAKIIHLVAWDDVCRSKEEGGLGLRNARKQNKAFMMKLGWGLVNRRETLWVKLIREKYKCSNDILPTIGRKKVESQAWKGVRQTWALTEKGIGWKLGDGSRIRFWEDCWIPNHEKLLQFAIREVPESMREELVTTYVSDSGTCEWQKFAEFLPNTILNTINQTYPYVHGESCDRPVWKGSSNGEFLVKAAYSMLSGESFVSNKGNLSQTEKYSGVTWSTWFNILYRHVWFNSNEGVFQDKAIGPQGVICKARAQTVWADAGLCQPDLEQSGYIQCSSLYRNNRAVMLITKLVEEIKYNQACGGITCRTDGSFVHGFMFHMRRGSSLQAEIWRVVWALKRAWDLRWRKVIVEMDCWEITELFGAEWNEAHPEGELLSKIRSWMSQDWETRIEWCSRDKNTFADTLAKEALQIAPGAVFFDSPLASF
ncbi:uncharacterized protein LOC114757563 [Neltuma alba]|uniref:uncharacterized protein LOC114757563 n=1 Tax=Neltuma alba TaxID=207710 RepID=UPI0010A313CA|nr:uncharacterized protein LOC114757563 [Prosopis alba]